MFQNKIKYLKVYFSDSCNYSCLFCKKDTTVTHKRDRLNFFELVKLVDAFARYGIEYVRLIGAEPLLEDTTLDFIYAIRSMRRIKNIALTTNGYLLKDFALALKGAGLDRVNISLPSLNIDSFRKITGVDGFARVMQGICAAKDVDLKPIRINVVLIKDLNDDEIQDFAALTVLYPLEVRFIEYFPDYKKRDDFQQYAVPGYIVRNRIESCFGQLEEDSDKLDFGPAAYYKIKNAKGRIGFINQLTEFFCSDCNSLWLMADGRVYPCCHSSSFIDLKAPLRKREFKLLGEKIKDSLFVKPGLNRDYSFVNFKAS